LSEFRFNTRAEFNFRSAQCNVVEEFFLVKIFGGSPTATRSAGFQTCCVADFQVGKAHNIQQHAGLETRDTADLEVCATLVNNSRWNFGSGVL
jgi:hypothetical protein